MRAMAVAIFTLLFCATSRGERIKPTSEYLQIGGVRRHYLAVLPDSVADGRPIALVLVFHPKNTDAALMEASSDFSALATPRRFIAIFPDGMTAIDATREMLDFFDAHPKA